jgi:hypothetical protein
LYVEEHEVRAEGSQELHRVSPVFGFADNFNIRFVVKAETDGVSRERLIVDDHGFDGWRHSYKKLPTTEDTEDTGFHPSVLRWWNGIVMRTEAPPSWALPYSNP